MKYLTLISLAVIVGVLFCCSQTLFAASPPYPPSRVFKNITFDFSSLTRGAPGSDAWPITWAKDGNLYTAWGDGGGFGGTNSDGRVSFGVARVEGTGDNWAGFNIWGGKNPESSQKPTTGKTDGGIICIEGVLYIYVEEQDTWTRCRLLTSADHGMKWTDLGWIFEEKDRAFENPGILQFGEDYSGSKDNYVYGYGGTGGDGTQIFLFRVPKNQLAIRSSYEFFSGFGENNIPIWSSDINDKKPIFTDPNGVEGGINALYHKQTGRYLLTVAHDQSGSWGIFDAPEPWGPWTTVGYFENWIDSNYKFTFVFNQKWMSPDGLTMWMVFSGTGKYDSFNVIKANLTLRDPVLRTRESRNQTYKP